MRSRTAIVLFRATPSTKDIMQQCYRFAVRSCRRLAVALPLALLLLAGPHLGQAHAELKLIEERSSNYNNIYVYKDGPQIYMTFGHNKRFYTETIYDTRDELALPVAYTR